MVRQAISILITKNNIMEKQKLEHELKSLIFDMGWDDINDMPENFNFRNDLGFDSLDDVELILSIEREYSINITDEEIEKVFTFNDAVELIVLKLS